VDCSCNQQGAAKEERALDLAPCGLSCKRCAMYSGGEIKRLSIELKDRLTGFERMADRMAGMNPVFASYSQFVELLSFFGSAGCAGCRSGQSPYPMCAAKDCAQSGQEFCFSCAEYPCNKNRYSPDQHASWLKRNDRIKEVGLEQYYAEQASRPRY